MKKKSFKVLLGKIAVLSLIACLGCGILTGCGDDWDDDYYDDDYDDWDDDDWDDDWDDDDWDDDDYYDDYYDDDYDDWDDWDDDYDDDGYYDDDDDDYYGGSNYGGGSSSNFGLFSNLGSAGELDGTTVLVSIYVNDKATSWSSSDSGTMRDTLKYMKIATDWISDNVYEYGCNANFVYDWSNDDSLYYEAALDLNIQREEDYLDSLAWDYVENNIDSEAILRSYNADNIVYMWYINSPTSNTNTSCTRNYYDGMDYPYEMCYMYMFCDGEEEAPAAFAHEILHTFGAPDLYTADQDGSNYGITQQYVNQLEDTYSNDIMFTTYDCETSDTYYDYISNEFTEIDAYYVGVTNHSSVVNEWGFEPSQH